MNVQFTFCVYGELTLFGIKSLNQLFQDNNQNLGKYGTKIKISSDLLETLHASQFEGVKYESDNDIQSFYI